MLIVDKPVGPTSHDVVAHVRRVLGERRIGHTGTLDPGASGVLPLVIGRATRLARFLSAADKTYEAVVRLGSRTETDDAEGQLIGSTYAGPLPSRDAIDSALDNFRGTVLQQPPIYSAKKISGRRSYRVARAHARLRQTTPGDPPDPSCPRDRPDSPGRPGSAVPPALQSPPALAPAPVEVTARSIDIVGVQDDTVTLRVACSAGFYVRALAHDLGERLGIGAHLAGLRRVRSGDFGLADAVGLDTIDRSPEAAIERVIPLSRMLPALPSVVLTADGLRRARHGLDVGPADSAAGPAWMAGRPAAVRLLDAEGRLVAVARPDSTSGLLHPFVLM